MACTHLSDILKSALANNNKSSNNQCHFYESSKQMLYLVEWDALYTCMV